MLQRTRPGDVVLDMTSSPIVHVLADRDGPGGADIIMPAPSSTPQRSSALIARLERNPPKLVLWPTQALRRRRIVAASLRAGPARRLDLRALRAGPPASVASAHGAAPGADRSAPAAR